MLLDHCCTCYALLCRLHQCVTLIQPGHQHNTLAQLVQRFHGYTITAISQPGRGSNTDSGTGDALQNALSLHINPPVDNSNLDDNHEVAAAAGDVGRELLGEAGSFSQPAGAAQQQQQQGLAEPRTSGVVVKQEGQQSMDDQQSSQQQQQQVSQQHVSMQASASRQPQQQVSGPRDAAARAQELHQELESRPPVAVKQEHMQQHDIADDGGHLQSPFADAAAAAAAAALAAAPLPQQPQQLSGLAQHPAQQQQQAQQPGAAAAAAQPAASGGASGPLGSQSISQQHSSLLQLQLDQLQMPQFDQLSDEVVSKLCDLSNILVGLGSLSEETAVTFQELLLEADDSKPEWISKLTKRCKAIANAVQHKQFHVAGRHIARLVETWPGATG